MSQRKGSDPSHVLVLDDEPALVTLMQRFLERQQYQVGTAMTFQQGKSSLESEPDRFDVLIADLSLFGARPEEKLQQLAQLSPRTQVLVCSGQPFALEVLPRDLQSRCAFLQKPFLPAMLIKAVAGLIER